MTPPSLGPHLKPPLEIKRCLMRFSAAPLLFSFPLFQYLAGARAEAPASPLPRLNISPSSLTISGISSGADLAAHFAVAFSDVTSGAAIFAGAPWMCAVTRFPGEPTFSCADVPYGPGCAGMPSGFAECVGCGADGNATLVYDHCKNRGAGVPPAFLDVGTLAGEAVAAARAGLIAPLSGLSALRTFLYRGTEDSCYLDGSVNFTADFFRAFAAQPAEQVLFVADVPSGHCTPTVDPFVPVSSCVSGRGAPPGMENCGFDGAGAAFAHLYAGIVPPASHECGAACAARVIAFNQTLYATGVWAGLSSVGYAYVPVQCGAGAPCRLHVALHGCGMSVWSPAMNSSYVLHAGFNPYADANDIVVIYPQGGAFLEQNDTRAAPTPMIGAGCFDGYGQTSPDFAWRTSPQMATIRAMVAAVAGF